MEKEDALNYQKTLENIGGVGVAPVPVEISMACIAHTLRQICWEIASTNMHLNKIAEKMMPPGAMQSAINSLGGPLSGNASSVNIAIQQIMKTLEQLKEMHDGKPHV